MGLPTISYGGTIGSTVGLDGEGRITQVTAASGQNPVTGASYNTGSLPTQVNFGSGDNDIFAYDSNTLRMTEFKFNVGTQSKYLNGVPTWNANGSLGQLAVTDQFNSANTQTCNYTHDDLARIATANCGSAANQTFSFDPFGNINKSGSPNSFQPTYSAATNRFSSIPGCSSLSYDNNGNVTNDCNHAYAWDADGNSVTLDSVALTFDAFDRMVEQNRSGSYTQIVYGAGGGKLALMSGQTLTKAFVPLPGQATAVYTSSGLDHYRHSDWLGSARLTSSPSQSYVSSVAYAPFGETYASSGTTDPSFTGMNPDTTGSSTSSDYGFLAREYSNEGRWVSPDPAGLAAVDPSNPQSWNRYSYVFNDPMDWVDPLGLCGGTGPDPAIPCPDVTTVTVTADGSCPLAGGWVPFTFGGMTYFACVPPSAGAAIIADLQAQLQQYMQCGNGGCTGGGNTSGGNFKPTVAYTFSLVVPLYFGFGPAITLSYVPSQNLFCGGGGGGVSLGHSVSVAPVLLDANHTKDILGGTSISGGYNSTPYQGAQGSINTSGTTGGPSFGIPGFSGSVTYSGCHNF